MAETIRVGFVGNPNCGKTTLFNAFTGANLKVANWPGVTVERVEGETWYKGQHLKLIDLPGIYSLTSYSIEEKVTRKCINDNEIDVIVNVVDASSLERNLYLTLQLLELRKPVILALNMMDIVEERGMEIDLHRLPEMLGGIPVVPVSARKRTGLDVLLHAVVHHYTEEPQGQVMTYSRGLEAKIQKLSEMIREKEPNEEHVRWKAIKLLECDEEITKEFSLDLSAIVDKNYEKQIINEKYNYIEAVVDDCLMRKQEKVVFTDKVDSLLTHPVLGVPCFLVIMAAVFFFTPSTCIPPLWANALFPTYGIVCGRLTFAISEIIRAAPVIREMQSSGTQSYPNFSCKSAMTVDRFVLPQRSPSPVYAPCT